MWNIEKGGRIKVNCEEFIALKNFAVATLFHLPRLAFCILPHSVIFLSSISPTKSSTESCVVTLHFISYMPSNVLYLAFQIACQISVPILNFTILSRQISLHDNTIFHVS